MRTHFASVSLESSSNRSNRKSAEHAHSFCRCVLWRTLVKKANSPLCQNVSIKIPFSVAFYIYI